MAEFINFEAEIEDVNSSEDDETNNDTVSEVSFVDDTEIDTSANFYRQLANVENDLDQVLSNNHDEVLEDIEQFDEISNLNDGSDMKWKLMISKNQKLILKNLIKCSFQKNQKIKTNFVR